VQARRTNQIVQLLSQDASASMRRYCVSSCNNPSGRSCGFDILLAGSPIVISAKQIVRALPSSIVECRFRTLLLE
jgi:hypothetical protein